MRRILIAALTALAFAAPAQAATTGSEGSEAEVLAGTGPTWVNPINATAGHPTSYAESQFIQGETTKQLEVKHFSLGLPPQATIKGIQVAFNPGGSWASKAAN